MAKKGSETPVSADAATSVAVSPAAGGDSEGSIQVRTLKFVSLILKHLNCYFFRFASG
jgi:hypothetical protein